MQCSYLFYIWTREQNESETISQLLAGMFCRRHLVAFRDPPPWQIYSSEQHHCQIIDINLYTLAGEVSPSGNCRSRVRQTLRRPAPLFPATRPHQTARSCRRLIPGLLRRLGAAHSSRPSPPSTLSFTTCARRRPEARVARVPSRWRRTPRAHRSRTTARCPSRRRRVARTRHATHAGLRSSRAPVRSAMPPPHLAPEYEPISCVIVALIDEGNGQSAHSGTQPHVAVQMLFLRYQIMLN